MIAKTIIAEVLGTLGKFLILLKQCICSIDKFTRLCGNSIAWLLLPMVLLESLVVALRYGFDIGSIALQESVTFLHACCFLLGAAYALQWDEHVRVDIFYRNFSVRKQAWVNLLGYILFLVPVCGLIIWSSIEYVAQSWSIRETSADAGGLPGIYLLKTLIPIFALLLILQGLAEALRSLLTIVSDETVIPPLDEKTQGVF